LEAVLMHNWLGVTLTCIFLGVPAYSSAAQPPPAPEGAPLAQTSLGYNPKSRCPDLRIADEGTIAVVFFWLPRSGTPSQIFLKSSSGSNALDSAALGCVAKLRFAPGTRLGDGEAIDSWRQIAFRWAETPAMTQNPVVGTSRTSEAITAPPAPTAADARHDNSGGLANSVTVHVCVDDAGKLTQDPTIMRSSGNASLDQAAVKIAASGSAYYRPDTSSSGQHVSGCAQLAIKFEAK
jgi:TonB family protein